MKRIIICGSRTFNDYEGLKLEMFLYMKMRLQTEIIEIVSGGQVSYNAKTNEKYGADYLGEKYAEEMGFTMKRFPANWNQFGKQAGAIRNKEMAKYATHCVAFWDGKSKGTKMMIDIATKQGLEVFVVKLNAEQKSKASVATDDDSSKDDDNQNKNL